MIKTVILIINSLIILTANNLYAESTNCMNKNTPSSQVSALKADIQKFFKSTARWTEVKHDGSLEVTNRPPDVRLHINFSNPLKTQVTYGNKKRNDIQEICKKSNGFTIKSGNTVLTIIQTTHGLRSQFRIPILGKIETYYYMPTDEVENLKESELIMESYNQTVAI